MLARGVRAHDGEEPTIFNRNQSLATFQLPEQLTPTQQTHLRRGPTINDLGAPWPRDFTSLRGMQLQDLIVRHVRDHLAFVRYSPRNRVQKEVRSAMSLVAQCVEMRSLQDLPPATTELDTRTQHQVVAEFACRVQSAIVDFIETNRAASEKRQRALTGSVSGLVRAWGDLSTSARENAGRLSKLRLEW